MFDFLRNLTKSAEEKRHEAVAAYLDDAMSAQERERFATQLAQDPTLQAEVEQARAVKQSLQQLPPRRVPRNFALDPALYGRPAKQPLIQAYPVLRAATGLAAFFFIFALFAGFFVSGNSSSGAGIANAPFAQRAEESIAMDSIVVEESESAMAAAETMEDEAEAAEEMMEEAAMEAAPAEGAAPAEEYAMTKAPAEEEAASEEEAMPVAASPAPLPENEAMEGEAAADTEQEEALPSLTATPTAVSTLISKPTERAITITTETSDAVANVVATQMPEESIQATAVSPQPEPEPTTQPINTLLLLQIGLLLLLLILGAITLYTRRQL